MHFVHCYKIYTTNNQLVTQLNVNVIHLIFLKWHKKTRKKKFPTYHCLCEVSPGHESLSQGSLAMKLKKV